MKAARRQELSQALVWLCIRLGIPASERAREQTLSQAEHYDPTEELTFTIEGADVDRLGDAITSTDPEALVIRQWLDENPRVLGEVGLRARNGILRDVVSLAPMVEEILSLTHEDMVELDRLTKSMCWILANVIQGTENGAQNITTYLNTYTTLVGEIRRAQNVPSPSPAFPFICLHPRDVHEEPPKKLVTLN